RPMDVPGHGAGIANTSLLDGAQPRGPGRAHAPPNTYYSRFAGWPVLPGPRGPHTSNHSRWREGPGWQAMRLTARLQAPRVSRCCKGGVKGVFSGPAHGLHLGGRGVSRRDRRARVGLMADSEEAGAGGGMRRHVGALLMVAGTGLVLVTVLAGAGILP